MAEKDRKHYEKLFSAYPDVVDLLTVRKMLGGVSAAFIRDRIKKSKIKSFWIFTGHRNVYMIPKAYVIDYILSSDYQSCKHMLKAQV